MCSNVFHGIQNDKFESLQIYGHFMNSWKCYKKASIWSEIVEGLTILVFEILHFCAIYSVVFIGSFNHHVPFNWTLFDLSWNLAFLSFPRNIKAISHYLYFSHSRVKFHHFECSSPVQISIVPLAHLAAREASQKAPLDNSKCNLNRQSTLYRNTDGCLTLFELHQKADVVI